ncbi:uncharacterized protein LOC128953181 [Oppia nitens]|uniref:uncharacterized protein LOC128953181 n=1 Tax=Oppia nitens TaxID=1686743 RepID=UPI0023DA26A0|nr:uncharacterized protein LOC128953181 [Oppia nitens]
MSNYANMCMLILLSQILLSLLSLNNWFIVGINANTDNFDFEENTGKLRKAFCVPTQTDTQIVRKLIDCEDKSLNGVSNDLKQLKTQYHKIEEQCLNGMDGDISAYSKVDLKDEKVKRFLLSECSQKFIDCTTNKLSKDETTAKNMQKLYQEFLGSYKKHLECAKKVLNI